MLAAQVYLLGALDRGGRRRLRAAAIRRRDDPVGHRARGALLAPRARVAASVGGGAALVCVYWNLALIAQFGAGLMSRQRLEPARNAYDAFVTVPAMAPNLAYRYLFDRSSFYGRPPAGEREP
jgi:hypothetical protein